MHRLEYFFGASSKKISIITWVVISLVIAQAVLSISFIVYIGIFSKSSEASISGIIGSVADSRHIQAVVNSLLMAVIISTLLTVLSAVVSLLFRWCNLTGNQLFYALGMIPLLIPDQVYGVAGRVIFDPSIGLLAGFLPKTILVDRYSSICLVSGITLMKWLPSMIIVADASILGIGKEKLNQIEIDFSSFIQAVLTVYLPIMKNILLVIFSFGFLIGFRQHELANELTSGGGGFVAETWSVWNYRVIFEFNDLVSGTLQASLVLIVLLIPILIIKKYAQYSLFGNAR